MAEPLRCFDVNVGGAIALLSAMERHQTQRPASPSSATVYGTPETNPIPETAPLSATSPYGRTKLMIEEIIGDWVGARPHAAAISLRYFNPVGAHPSGLIGERPNGMPNNLFPFIAETAAGLRDRVRVFGDDYPTAPGSATISTSSTWRAATSLPSTSWHAARRRDLTFRPIPAAAARNRPSRRPADHRPAGGGLSASCPPSVTANCPRACWVDRRFQAWLAGPIFPGDGRLRTLAHGRGRAGTGMHIAFFLSNLPRPVPAPTASHRGPEGDAALPACPDETAHDGSQLGPLAPPSTGSVS